MTTSLGTVAGTVLAVQPDRLVLHPDHDRPVGELQLDASTFRRLEVRLHRRSRARGAALGLIAVAIIPVSAFFLDTSLGGPSGWPRDRQDQISFCLIYGTPLLGAAVGFWSPGSSWGPAALPRDTLGR